MITEDYVSFETAKLLKEKGFDINAINSWHIVPSQTCNFEDLEKVVCGDINEPEYSEDYYPMITLQMVMKWLREMHDFNINTELNIHGYFCSLSHIVRDPSGSIIDIEDSEAWETAYYDSYEQAVEAAVKYCLENLI